MHKALICHLLSKGVDAGNRDNFAGHRGKPRLDGLAVYLFANALIDGFGQAGGQPSSLAVGKIDPAALPKGRSVIVTAGGDAGDGGGARRWGLNTHHGWTLALTDAQLTPGDAEGCVGAIA